MPKLVKATAAERHVRALFFGKGGGGKTHLSLSGPSPKLFPVEGRYENFYDLFDFELVEYDEKRIVDEYSIALHAAMRGEYGPGSFITDSWTVLEKALRAEQNYNTDDNNAIVRRTALANRREKMEDTLLDLLRGTTKVDLIFTAHQANKFGEGSSSNAVVDVKPDCTRNFEHAMDIVGHLWVEQNGNGSPGKRYLKIYKSAYAHIHPVGKVIENPTWENVMVPLKTPQSTTKISTPAPAAAQRAAAPATRTVVTPPAPATTIPGEQPQPYTEENPPRFAVIEELYAEAHKPGGDFKTWVSNELIEISERDGKRFFDRPALWKMYQLLTAIIKQINDEIAA